MKKFLAILAVGAILTACNNGSDEKPATTDSPKVETPVMDATKTADSAGKMGTDTANKMMEKVADTAHKMVEKAKEEVKH